MNWWNVDRSKTPRGALNFGLHAMCNQKDSTFYRSLSPRDHHFYQLSPNDPLFLTNSLSPKDLDTSLVTQRPLIFSFNSQTSDNFWQKIWFFEHFNKFDEMLRNFWPIFWCISLKDPLFCALYHWKTPFLDTICHRKTPSSEVLGGTCMSLSYVRHFHTLFGSVVQRFMGLPRTRKGHGSSPNRGACWDLISFHFHNSEFNRCGGID